MQNIWHCPFSENPQNEWYMGDVTAEGEASLYFFPNGFTQDALIHVENEGGQVFTVKVAALTGKTRVYAEYIEVEK